MHPAGGQLTVRICYLGGFDPQYSRNNFLRQALAENGCEVVMCRVPPGMPTAQKYPQLIAQYAKVWRNCDLLLVPESQQTTVPLGWMLARLTGKPVVFDFFLSMHEMVITERRQFSPRSRQARRHAASDRLAGYLPDILLVQTRRFASFLQARYQVQPAKMHVAPLGVNDAVFFPRNRAIKKDPARLTVLYFGSYIPNHGVPVILDAIALLRADRRFHFRFVGDGEGKAAALAAAQARGLEIEFVPRVDFSAVPQQISDADIVLGVFGDTPQADMALANKVLQPLAMCKTVLAGDTHSIREHFVHGEHLQLVPLANAAALADGLRALAADAGMRTRLAEAGYERFRERVTPRVVGAVLRARLERLLTAR
ncbi:MAG: glycosyltransferase [Chloroflexi bacterium]|nr:MAG: glycosyltransferase [Chloroflexota bacterium]